MSIDMGLGLLTLLAYAAEIALVAIAVFPGVLLCHLLWLHTAGVTLWARLWLMCLAGVGAYFLYGVTLIALVGALRRALRLRLPEGEYPLRSLVAVKWGLAVALKSPASFTFLNLLLMTPFASVFYRLMGATIGRDVQINTKSCADPSLLEIGDGSVIGGHATILGHAFEHGRLILRKVKIGSHVVVGLNAVILPGVEVGDGATIAAGAIVPKGTRVPAGSLFFGTTAHAHPKTPVSVPPPDTVEFWR